MTRRSEHGFTLVETTLAVAFLAILLMAILTLTMAAGRLYLKGNTNQTINQSGRDFADSVRRDFLAAGMSTISPLITVSGGPATSYSGRICLGSVTYLWNSADLLNATTTLAKSVTITMGSAANPPAVKFARVVNPKVSYCVKNVSGQYPTNIPSTEQATDLFGGTDRDYALYSMTMQPIVTSGEKGMYEITYTLGTNEAGTTQVDPSGGFLQCKPNNTLLGDFNYCAVDSFDMIVRVGGTV